MAIPTLCEIFRDPVSGGELVGWLPPESYQPLSLATERLSRRGNEQMRSRSCEDGAGGAYMQGELVMVKGL